MQNLVFQFTRKRTNYQICWVSKEKKILDPHIPQNRKINSRQNKDLTVKSSIFKFLENRTLYKLEVGKHTKWKPSERKNGQTQPEQNSKFLCFRRYDIYTTSLVKAGRCYL